MRVSTLTVLIAIRKGRLKGAGKWHPETGPNPGLASEFGGSHNWAPGPKT